jgi:hypothetical protein
MKPNGRRAIIGLCMLSALLVNAFAAQGASAAGTTGYTCVEDPNGPLMGEHCLASGGSGTKHKHASIANNTTTELTASNETTGGVKDVMVLQATVAGASFKLTATTMTASGWMTNAEEGGEMFAHGEGTATFTGVTSDSGCKVFTHSPKGEEGVVHTETLKATTKGQGHAVKFEPASGTVLARFILEGCTNPGINGTYTVTGSIKTSSISGATANFMHVDTTNQNTLKLNGTIKAGLDGTATFKTRANSGEPYKALSATT